MRVFGPLAPSLAPSRTHLVQDHLVDWELPEREHARHLAQLLAAPTRGDLKAAQDFHLSAPRHDDSAYSSCSAQCIGILYPGKVATVRALEKSGIMVKGSRMHPLPPNPALPPRPPAHLGRHVLLVQPGQQGMVLVDVQRQQLAPSQRGHRGGAPAAGGPYGMHTCITHAHALSALAPAGHSWAVWHGRDNEMERSCSLVLWEQLVISTSLAGVGSLRRKASPSSEPYLPRPALVSAFSPNVCPASRTITTTASLAAWLEAPDDGGPAAACCSAGWPVGAAGVPALFIVTVTFPTQRHSSISRGLVAMDGYGAKKGTAAFM
jgi:hypothetical protein